MAVAGEEDQVCRRGFAGKIVELFARPRIAVPGVGVEWQSCPPLGCKLAGIFDRAAAVRRARSIRVGQDAKSHQVRDVGARDRDGIADQAPRLSGRDRLRQAAGQIGFALGRDHSPPRCAQHVAAEFGDRLGIPDLVHHRRIIDLLGPRRVAGFQRGQRRQIAEAVTAPELRLCAARLVQPFRLAHRHPFKIGLHRGGSPCVPSPFPIGLMVLRTAGPRVVGAFMIVPAG